MIRDIVEALKLEHTLFALPFAYLGVWAAAGGRPAWSTIGWVTLAMAAARSAGMAANRLIDRPIDRLNPRTKNWPVSAGRVKPVTLTAIIFVGAGLLVLSASRLNQLCLWLAPWALALMFFYPVTKRFTWTCHFWLGLVLAAAPAAGWLAVTGAWSQELIPLAAGVLFWVAGFDILYALLDLEFDRRHGVHSIPQRFGIGRALAISRACHIAAVLGFAGFGILVHGGFWYWAAVAVMAALLAYEHSLVQPDRLDRINKAFFTVNGWISISFFLLAWLDLKSRIGGI